MYSIYNKAAIVEFEELNMISEFISVTEIQVNTCKCLFTFPVLLYDIYSPAIELIASSSYGSTLVFTNKTWYE